MEAPKCKICGERHYGICQPTIDKFTTMEKTRPNLAKFADELVEKAKFDRNAYQREYMRKKRAKDKDKLK